MTPIHKNATFFKQNAQQLIANDGFLLRRLVKICEHAIENEDYQTIKVVLNDYEMFMQNYPLARDYVDRIDGMLKTAMNCLKIEDVDVQALAVRTVSRLLLNRVV